MKLQLRVSWIVAALGLALVTAAAVTAVVLLAGGSKAPTAQELAHKVATASSDSARQHAASELVARLDPAAVTSLVQLAASSAQAKAGLSWVESDLAGLYDEPGASLDQRRGALLCLGRIADEDAGVTVVDALVSAHSPVLRNAAATSLTQGGPLSPVVAEQLVMARRAAFEAATRRRVDQVIVAVGKPAVLPLLEVIRGERVPERSWATKLIGRIGLPALPLLQSKFASDQLNQAAAAIGLLELRKRYPAQIQPLVPQIMAKALSRLSAPVPAESEIDVLAEIGKPAVAKLMALRRKSYDSLSPRQQNLSANADLVLAEIAKLNPKGASPLLGALERRDYRLIAYFHNVFIMLGKPGSEKVLIDALNADGDSLMALDFLNSGNQKLVQAAKSWASSHGYTVTPGVSSNDWGTAGG